MDWFERLTGFRETSYNDTRRRLEIDGCRLRSCVNGKSYAIGELELVSLQTLRERVYAAGGLPGRIRVQVVTGDVRRLHQLPEYAGAYALCTHSGLDAITGHLASLTPEQTDTLRGMLRIGVHRDVEVTDADGAQLPMVSQAFCSALPVWQCC